MIKNIIYLDEQKMYSLSSQLFEGITEYVLNESISGNEESETQKGPVGSGRILADVIITSGKQTEKKFLHDFSYSVFEKYLTDENKVLGISGSETSLQSIAKNISNYSFVRVKLKATFNDIEKINELFINFNTMGEAIAHVTSFEEIEKIKKQINDLKSDKHDKNDISKLNFELKRLTSLKSLAKDQGLYQDQKFLDNIALLTKYGFSDQFEIQQNSGEVLFTSCLKRDCLREKEDLLVKKYSRKTEKEIVVFGLISQAFSETNPEINDNQDFKNMKAALMNLIEHLANIENSISGKQENEIVIDPIAVYIEV